MKKEPLVSVIMPVYNGERFLKESLDSILYQTYKHIEVIIINDGSTDNTSNILKSYRDTRIKILVNEPNQGLVRSLNRAINEAQGTLLARMDADDIALSRRIQTQVSIFEKQPELALCGSDYFLKNNQNVTTKRLAKSKGAIQANTLFNSPFAHPTVVFNRSIIPSEVLQYDPDYTHVEDYELWSRIVFKYPSLNLNTPLLYYRQHEQQVSAIHQIKQAESIVRVQKNILATLNVTYHESELKFFRNNYKPESLLDFESAISFFEKIKQSASQINTIDHLEFDKYLARFLLSKSLELKNQGYKRLMNSSFASGLTQIDYLKHWIKLNITWIKNRS